MQYAIISSQRGIFDFDKGVLLSVVSDGSRIFFKAGRAKDYANKLFASNLPHFQCHFLISQPKFQKAAKSWGK